MNNLYLVYLEMLYNNIHEISKWDNSFNTCKFSNSKFVILLPIII